MSVEQTAPPSITEIRRDLNTYEERYNILTPAFVAENGCVAGIDEDDAVEWLYRAEQLRILEEPDVFSPYARAERATSLKNCADVMELMDRLAA